MKRTSKIKNLKDLDEKIADLLEIQDCIKQYEAIAESLKAEIKECMDLNEEIVTENHKVKLTNVSSSRFDQSTFKASHPKLYKKFMKDCGYDRLYVS